MRLSSGEQDPEDCCETVPWPPRVAIIGGGCAGTLAAANLLRVRGAPLEVVMFERSGLPGAGVAYATRTPGHLLNVPAERMSAFSHQPLHFAQWAAARLGGLAPGCYLPRSVYGDYLRWVLADSRAAAGPGRSFELIADEVTDVWRSANGLIVASASHPPLSCAAVVLALGAGEQEHEAALEQDERIHLDPWAPGALEAPAGKHPALVLGTGLSGVDAALTLAEGGAQVIALSRSGEVPRVSLPGLREPAPAPALPDGPISLVAMERMLRAYVRSMESRGYDWRDAVDGLRPVTPGLWSALSARARRRFLRDRRRAWDARRHRMSPSAGERVQSLTAQGRLRWARGGLVSVRAATGALKVRVVAGDAPVERELSCGSVVLCTGPGADVRRSGGRLVQRMLATGTASAGPLSLGLRTTPAGALIDAHGAECRGLYAIGSLRRGELWETTAVREIRQQAEDIAARLARSPAGARGQHVEQLLPSGLGDRVAAAVAGLSR